MRFKATILSCVNIVKDGYPSPLETPFIFTKRKILFTPKHGEKFYHLSIALSCPFQSGSDYTLTTEYNREDRKKFVITIAGDKNCKSYLGINLYNRFKLNWIHRRYLIHRDPDWIWKTLITAFIGFLFSIIGIILGYHLGHQDKLKESKVTHQDTTLIK